MPSVTLVSRPLGFPWFNGSTRLVRELIYGFSGVDSSYRFQIISRKKFSIKEQKVGRHIVDSKTRESGRIARNLLCSKSPNIMNFFFAPNYKTAIGSRLISRVKRAIAVQTICSLPNLNWPLRVTFFGNKIIVLSRWMYECLKKNGVVRQRLVTIPPPIKVLSFPSEHRVRAIRIKLELGDVPIILFPGDSESGGGLRTFARAIPEIVRRTGAGIVLSCRSKSAEGLNRIKEVRKELSVRGVGRHCRVIESCRDFAALLAAADLCVLPASTLYAKIDYPYALLEAMSLYRPIVVCKGTPPEELIQGGGGVAVAEKSPSLLAEVVCDIVESKGLKKKYGRRAHEMVRELCNPANIARQYIRVYEDEIDRVKRVDR